MLNLAALVLACLVTLGLGLRWWAEAVDISEADEDQQARQDFRPSPRAIFIERLEATEQPSQLAFARLLRANPQGQAGETSADLARWYREWLDDNQQTLALPLTSRDLDRRRSTNW